MRTILLLALTACAGDTDSKDDPQDSGGPVDPGPEDCSDGVDNNGNGQIDCADESCDDECVELCEDELDNDADQLVDCADPDCPACLELCDARNEDEDGDGLIDCADPDCTDACTELCRDDVDNDADGLIDCVDDECVGQCDQDGDSYLATSFGGDDCDDEDPAVHPGAPDPCGDGIDGDCLDGDPECPGSTGDTSDTGAVTTTVPGDTSDTSDTGP